MSSIDKTDATIHLSKSCAELHDKLAKELIIFKSMNEQYENTKRMLEETNNSAWEKLSILSSKWLNILDLCSSNVYISEGPNEELDDKIALLDKEINGLAKKIHDLVLEKLLLYKTVENLKIIHFEPKKGEKPEHKFIESRKQCFKSVYKGIIQYKIQSFNLDFDPNTLDKELSTLNQNGTGRSWFLYTYPLPRLTGFEDCPKIIFHTLILDYYQVSDAVDKLYEEFVQISDKVIKQNEIVNDLKLESKNLMNQLNT